MVLWVSIKLGAQNPQKPSVQNLDVYLLHFLAKLLLLSQHTQSSHVSNDATRISRRYHAVSIFLRRLFLFLYKGRRQGFYKLRQHYAILLSRDHDGSVDSLLRSELPSLVPGISPTSAFHAIEDLGYAYSIDYPVGVCDALAYLHHSYRPMVIRDDSRDGGFGTGQEDFQEVLEKLGKDYELLSFLQRERSNSGGSIKRKLNQFQVS